MTPSPCEILVTSCNVEKPTSLVESTNLAKFLQELGEAFLQVTHSQHSNEFRMHLRQNLHTLFLQELEVVFLQASPDLFVDHLDVSLCTAKAPTHSQV